MRTPPAPCCGPALSPHTPTAGAGPLTRLAALVIVALAQCLPGATTVQAVPVSEGLVRSVPAGGARVTTPPERIRLEFREDLVATGAFLRVGGPQGDVPTGRISVRGRVVTAPLTRAAPPGTYLVGWRLMTAAGRPLTGMLGFTVAGSAAASTPSASRPAGPSGTTSVSGAADPTAARTGAPRTTTGPTPPPPGTPPGTDASRDPLEALAGDDTGDGPPATLLALGALAAALGAGGLLVARRRRDQLPPSDNK